MQGTLIIIILVPNRKDCTTFHRYPIFSTRYSVVCKVYTGYCGTSKIEHGLCACTVDNLSVQAHKPCSMSHLLDKFTKTEITSKTDKYLYNVFEDKLT